MSQYLDKDGASRIAENFLSKQAEQDAILQNLQFDLKEAEHALVKTIQSQAPLNIRALTRPLDDYRISGNTIQDGTPTPEAPVDVVGCGVRTGNLFDKSVYLTGGTQRPDLSTNYRLVITGLKSNTQYTLSSNVPAVPGYNSLYIYDSPWTTYDACYVNHPLTYTTDSSGNLYFEYSRRSYYNNIMDGTYYVLLNEGPVALPYEPYGYKLPISCGGTTTNVYLGKQSATRRIKKLVLTGEEGWALWASGQTDVERYYYKWGKTTPSDSMLICTHFPFRNGDGNFEHIRIGGEYRDDLAIFISKTIASTVANFKSYLAAQYQNGTPVTLWYVLTEPETGIVNEPLHKIGNYADTISYAQAGVEISTTKGFNAITTDTTVLPSNIEVKGVINNA